MELNPVNCGCGGEARIGKIYGDAWTVECTECGIQSGCYDTETEAITAWNKAMGAKDINVPDKNGMSDLISINDMLKITTRVEKIHPYKVVGDRDSYSPYNEGWNDCVSLIESYLEKIPVVEPIERTAKVVHSEEFGDWKNMCGNCFEAGKKMGLFPEQKYCYECGCRLEWK